jgi:hypothetical protein
MLNAVVASGRSRPGFKLPASWERYDDLAAVIEQSRDAAVVLLVDVGRESPPIARDHVKNLIKAFRDAKVTVEHKPGEPWDTAWESFIKQARDKVDEKLAPFRECLARLAAEPATIWFHGGVSYSKDRLTPRCVPPEMHNLLQKFLDGDEAFDTEPLEDTGVSNVTRVVGKIEEAFGPGPVSGPQGKKGAGYYIRVRTLPKRSS